MFSRIRTAGLVLAAGLGLAACTDGYGYSGVNLGYGGGGYYGDPYYDGYGYGGGYYGAGYAGNFGSPYWGWQGDYYYPGTGVYVYDRNRRAVRWNGAQQRYWQGRRNSWRGDRREVRANWRDYRQERRVDTRNFRQDRRGDRRALRQGQVTRPEFRAERRQDRRAFRSDARRDTRQLRRANRRDRRD
ncbi:peptidase [Sphingomonas japonica]|uniref:Peptidase n=1 Tax=Sphingomonas japonica TaxID=511662 RepID=A0ABX0U0N1_9SPHN|nr:peptidase [Sphingomonas japonica]NIJ22942.1 hypothetical protein [Sphingomonas japonica]